MEKRHGFTDKAIAVGEYTILVATSFFFFLFLKVVYFQTIIIMIKLSDMLSDMANMISFMGKIKITPMRNNLKE